MFSWIVLYQQFFFLRTQAFHQASEASTGGGKGDCAKIFSLGFAWEGLTPNHISVDAPAKWHPLFISLRTYHICYLVRKFEFSSRVGF